MILVTGGTGLVGSHLLYQLSQQETSIRAIYRTTSSKEKVKEIFSYYTNNPEMYYDKIEWVKADITDIPSMMPVFKDVTKVYHCAALISFKTKDYLQMRKVNIHGTAIVVNLSVDAGVKKFCYVSSIAAIGENPAKEFIDEENEWNDNKENSGYAISKYGGEMEVWRGGQEGMEVVVVNPGIILGPGFWYSGSGKLFSQIAKGFPFYTEGVSGYVGVNDVVKSMVFLMESKIKNERYILVSENKTFKEAFYLIAKSLKVKPPTRKISPFLTSIFWRFEALKSKILRKSPKLTKQGATSLHTKSFYENDKIKGVIDFEFETVEESIKSTARFFR